MHFIDFTDPAATKSNGLTQIFVHGYEGVRNERDIQRLTMCVRRAKPEGRCLLMCWGDWLDLPDDGHVFQRLATTAEMLTRGAGERTGKPPWMDGFEAAASETLRFWSHAAEAEQAGKQFATRLHDLGLSTPLRLWGHSLGARLLLAALAHPDWSLPVERAVMMGAAADTHDALWRGAAENVSRLINVHSANDLVLRVAPLWSPVAGLRPVRCEGVENCDCGFQHHEYWPRLDELIGRLG